MEQMIQDPYGLVPKTEDAGKFDNAQENNQ
jgi:hypothetical protein